jgi:sugar/nucleoside kinase (ribokinase family)
MTLVVLGDLMVDVVARVESIAHGADAPAQITVSGGGSAANVAAWAAALGTPVALVTNVGDDERGRTALDELRAAGVELHATIDPHRPTGTCVVIVERGERTMLSDAGANDAPLAEIPLGDHLHVAGYALVRDGPRASALAAIERARWGDVHVAAVPVEVVDTTGAGDAFAAGLLGARLDGAGRREALEAGCAAAARVVAQVGARPS